MSAAREPDQSDFDLETGAKNLASQVDVATMNQLARKINGDLVPPKGLK